MSQIFHKALEVLGDGLLELYWLAGVELHGNNWMVRAVFKENATGKYHMLRLPIGFLPALSLGTVFERGQMLMTQRRGFMAETTIADVAEGEEVTSADIPAAVYAFGQREAGVQHLLRYRTTQGVVLVPTIELIRYLFLHNLTLANAILRPGGLTRLFYPQLPGYQEALTLRFTSQMPRSSLSSQFAQEFAWIALDRSARKSWDSVLLKTHGQQFVSFDPPAIKNSHWRFRGINHENCWLVLELLYLTGRIAPCRTLQYGHPSMKKPSVTIKASRQAEAEEEPPTGDDVEAADGTQRTIYQYELEDGIEGSKKSGIHTSNAYAKTTGFDEKITVTKLLVEQSPPSFSPDDGAEESQKARRGQSGGTVNQIHKKISVSATDTAAGAQLSALDFRVLTPCPWEQLGDLAALAETVRKMANRFPTAAFAMALCQLKQGRVFSIAANKPRVALVVSIQPPDGLPIVLLDVERTGDVALSLVAMHFHQEVSWSEVEESIKQLLDGLVDRSGHWDSEVEVELSSVCTVDRLPKMLFPRSQQQQPGQTNLWAVKLLHRLGLGLDCADNAEDMALVKRKISNDC